VRLWWMVFHWLCRMLQITNFSLENPRKTCDLFFNGKSCEDHAIWWFTH
jgi:hypothetical protein